MNKEIIVGRLEEDMLKASEQLNYEKALELKNMLNDINITFVRFENSKEEFLMKNGLNYFCFQFEYL